ncbi:hypothetical protein CU100_08505 [Phyllobacterium endophyticum]|uniref:Uncharacterized protein n=1 Tax=Phyllobacterium endophyticum TaxID=1149773 RepID=A0A2P7AU73_9HYPH|nr:hypothetical protein CU100_08505 [Phyllobacterium endophyticum]
MRLKPLFCITSDIEPVFILESFGSYLWGGINPILDMTAIIPRFPTIRTQISLIVRRQPVREEAEPR